MKWHRRTTTTTMTNIAPTNIVMVMVMTNRSHLRNALTTRTPRFRATGRLRYSPTNNGKIIRRDGGTTKWWLVIDCNPNIGGYYRELYRMENHGAKTIQRPAWDAHISVVTNEKPDDKHIDFWKKYEGRRIEYEYVHQSQSNGTYVWLPVWCDEALDMREELGLNRNPYHPLHLTVGNCKEMT